MRDTRLIIEKVKQSNRKTRFINTFLWIIIAFLVAGAGWVANYAVQQKESVEVLLQKEEQYTTQLLKQKADLRASEESLEAEKLKLEEISVQYDSLRQQVAKLKSRDELWEQAVKDNTVQAYTDYIQVKGVNTKVLSKLETVLNRTGYVQIRESNGNMLFEQLTMEDPDNAEFKKLNLWVPKSTRSVRYGVIGKSRSSERTGDVIVKGQPVQIVGKLIPTGAARWAKIKY